MKVTKYLTTEELVDAMVDRFNIASRLDQDYIENLYRTNKLIELHHTVGRGIRNEFHLWDNEHPETAKWVTEGRLYDSPLHPDQYSNEIIRLMCIKLFGPLPKQK